MGETQLSCVRVLLRFVVGHGRASVVWWFDLVESAQWLYGDGCWLLSTWLSGCRGCQNAKRAVAVLRLRAPLESGGSPDGMHVCGFREVDPEQLDIAQSSQTRDLALVHTTRHYFPTTHAVNNVTCHGPGAYTQVVKTRCLREQSSVVRTIGWYLSDDVPAAPPDIKRRTYICKTTRKDMHIHVAIRTLERCMHVVQLLCIRSGVSFEDSSLPAGTRPDPAEPNLTSCDCSMQRAHFFGPLAEHRPAPQLDQNSKN